MISPTDPVFQLRLWHWMAMGVFMLLLAAAMPSKHLAGGFVIAAAITVAFGLPTSYLRKKQVPWQRQLVGWLVAMMMVVAYHLAYVWVFRQL